MKDCPVCEGTGRLLRETCPLCDGEDASEEDAAVDGAGTTAALAPPESFGGFFFWEQAESAEAEGLADLAGLLRNGGLRRIIVCTGAGISTSSGIPDFRSAGGTFELIRELLGAEHPEVAESPEGALSRDFAQRHPEAHARLMSSIALQGWAEARPGDCHLLLALLARRGLVRRVYTQNVDGLHQRAGVPPELVVETHGSMVRGDCVLYGDALPRSFFQAVGEDFPRDVAGDQCDLMLVIGSSLQVAPFCAVPNLVQRRVPRVLVTRGAQRCFSNAFSRDTSCCGSCLPSSRSCLAPSSEVKFGKRRVTLTPQWDVPSKYRRQWVFDADADKWARSLAAACGWSQELDALRSDTAGAR